MSVPAWGAESGLDNGFQTGEQYSTWALLIGNQTIPMDANGATMSNATIFSDSYSCQGFAELLSVNFEGEYELSYGCTDSEACNYDESATVDDGTCDYGQTWYADNDGDGLGDPNMSTVACDQINGFVSNDDDPCPNDLDNPNNTVIWYLDEDGDGLGTDLWIVYGCNPPGPDFADNADDPCPYSPLDENGEYINDSDGDGICDYEDDCIGQEDALGVCNGNCTNDDDADGICDDTDDCVGQYDACGVCNGPGEIYDCGCENIPDQYCDCNQNILDALGVCGGDCTNDDDADGICDDTDDCVGPVSYTHLTLPTTPYV